MNAIAGCPRGGYKPPVDFFLPIVYDLFVKLCPIAEKRTKNQKVGFL